MLPTLLSPGALEELCEAAGRSPAGGCFVEVGVYRGGSAQRLAQVAQEQGREIYLYDTFTGIPMKGPLDYHEVGDFADVDLAQIRAAIPEAIVVVGVFPQSMVAMGKVAFVHLDCDQYESIVESVQALKPLMMDGGAMLFNDYGCLEGATAAVRDVLGEENFTVTACGKALWLNTREGS